MSDKDDRDTNPFDVLMDAYDTAREFYDEHQQEIDSLVSNNKSLDLTDMEPLVEAHYNENMVLVVADVPGETPDNLGLNFHNGSLELDIAGTRSEVKVPEDIDKSTIEATAENGVLRVEMMRKGADSNEAPDGFNEYDIEDESDDDGGDE